MFVLILDSVADFHTVEVRRLHRIFGGLLKRWSGACKPGNQGLHPHHCVVFSPYQSPLSIIIWSFFKTMFFQMPYQKVQNGFANSLDPFRAPEPSNESWWYGVIEPNKGSANSTFAESVVSEATEDPQFRTIVGPVDCCGNVSAIRWIIVIILATKLVRNIIIQEIIVFRHASIPPGHSWYSNNTRTPVPKNGQ